MTKPSPSLKGLGRILVVEEDVKKAEIFRQELLLGFHGDQVEVVSFKWLAMIRLTGLKRYDFVLWRNQLVYPETAQRMISQEITKNIDWFEVDAEDGQKHEEARIQ